MGAARARWYSDQLPTVSGPDPFEVDVEDVGELIDLTGATARLRLRLAELLNREGRLEEMEITCDLKQLSEVACCACPVSKAGDDEVPLSALCRVGREQELVLGELAVLKRENAATAAE